MNKETPSQKSANHRSRRIPLKGFCNTHNRTIADFVCESCRIFYCDICLKENNSTSMKCFSCNEICPSLKEINRERAKNKEISEGFTGNDIINSFTVTGIGFYILSLVFVIANLASAKIYWGLLLLSSAFLVRRIKALYDNRDESDFKGEDVWGVFIKPSLTGILVGIFCFASLFVIGYKFYDSTTYLKMSVSEFPSANSGQIKAGISDEFTSLLNSDETKLPESTKKNNDYQLQKLKTEKDRAVNNKNNDSCYSKTMKSEKTGRWVDDWSGNGSKVEETELKPEWTENKICSAENEKNLSQINSKISNIENSAANELTENLTNSQQRKKFAALFVGFLIIGIFYYPLGLGISAISENVWDSINVLKGLGMAGTLQADYARVFFIWVIFLLIFTLTIYWEFQVLEIRTYQSPPEETSIYFYAVKISTGFIRVYLLVVLANMVGRMLYKNKFKLEKLS